MFSKLRKSFIYAFQGWRTAFRTQLNFRVQCSLAVVALLLGVVLHISTNEWLWLILDIAFVLAGELINTAIELLVDFVSPGYHEKAGRIKDMTAGAVTVIALNALLSGLIIFLPKLWQLLP